LNFARRIIDLLLFGNIYVALGAACLVQSTIMQLDHHDHLLPYTILTFFASLFVYNFQRIFYKPQENKSLHSVRRKWIFEHQLIIKVLAFIGIAGVGVTFFYNDFHIIFYLSPLLLLSLAYFTPAVKLRKSPWFKLFTLTFVWTMVTAIVPMLLLHVPLTPLSSLLHIFVRFTFMIAICLPFDIRDLDIDKADNISTIPHLLGENKTRWLAVVFMLIYIALIISEYALAMFGMGVFAGLIASAVINTGFVLMSSSKRDEYFFVAGLDGTMILQGVLLLLARYYF
jgi:4-hydroxybenzoate polyprenyltransferase